MTAMTWLRGTTPAQRRGVALGTLVLIMGVLSWLFVVQGQASVSGGLPGSTFESADGNLASNGAADWNQPLQAIDCGPAVTTTTPAPGVNCGQDLTKSPSDNAFGQGAKEDIPNPSVVAGSIPPNKSDLTRFYVNTETTTGAGAAKYLYLAWERSNVLGNANMDFEFNQSKVLDGNGVTNKRTAGDMLITFDFVNGGGSPDLGLLRWVTDTASVGTCFSSNSVPCWAGRIDLTQAGFANGAVSTTTVHDANTPPVGGADLPALTFGEAGINLTLAGVFPNGTCVNFGDAFLKSRSSASFTAEMKDFIAPVPVQISNCGTLVVHKYIDANSNGTKDTGEVNGAGWNFVVTGPGATTTVVCAGATDSNGNLACSSGNPGDLAKLLPGTYTITETQQSGFYNTDPGSGLADPVNTAPTAVKTGAVTLGGSATVQFGNECYVAKTFTVNQIPAGTSGMFVSYTVTAGHDAGISGMVPLTVSGTAASGVTNTFVQGDTINWTWGINNDATHLLAGATGDLLSGGCALVNTSHFAFSTIHAYKYKDVDSSGGFNSGDLNGAGFTFQLYRGTVVTTTALAATTTSGADGGINFTSLAPGTYTIHEVVPSGWVQTEPAAGADKAVTVSLGDQTVQAGNWGDTPLSSFSVVFTPGATLPGTTTPATQGAVSCVATGTVTPEVGAQTANTYSAGSQHIGTYNCTITITDP